DDGRGDLGGLPPDRAHPQAADGGQAVDLGEDPAGDGHGLGPLRGQGDAPAPPLEGRDAQLDLEAPDAAAERGLGDVQRCGRPRHRALVGRGDQVAQLLEVHVPPVPIDAVPASEPFRVGVGRYTLRPLIVVSARVLDGWAFLWRARGVHAADGHAWGIRTRGWRRAGAPSGSNPPCTARSGGAGTGAVGACPHPRPGARAPARRYPWRRSSAARWCCSGWPTAAMATSYRSTSPPTRTCRSTAVTSLAVGVRWTAERRRSSSPSGRSSTVPSATSTRPVGWASTSSTRPRPTARRLPASACAGRVVRRSTVV